MMYWAMNGSIFAILVIICACTPYVIRKNDVFGIYFPDSASELEQVRAMRFRFFGLCILCGLLCAGFWLVTVLFSWMNAELSFSVSLIGYLLLEALLYLYFHGKAKQMKNNHEFSYTMESHVAVDFTPQPRPISSWWFVPHILLLAMTAGVTIWKEPSLGDRIPIHWDTAGNVSYASKSFFSVYQLILLEGFMFLLFYGLLILVSHSKKVIRSDNPEESRRASFLFKKLWCGYFAILSFGCMALFSFLQFIILGICPSAWMTPVLVGFLIVVGLGSTALVLYTGQGGSRLLRIKGKTSLIDPREDDRYWKLGCIYYNPDDPSLMVEKRFGIGWTLNMARPAAYVLLAIIIVFVIVCLILSLLIQ